MAVLEKEFNYYLQHQDELVKEYDGKYIVLKDNAVAGVYDSQADAYFDSEKKYGLGNFLIQLCTAGDNAYSQTFSSRVIFA
ncbi:MAG: hypothetical protein IJ250_06545 [Bacteroidales bacterium]|nr:hypothetical protein [Bacteroidales bacterium]